MKKIFLLFISLILTLVSCYYSPVVNYYLTIEDKGECRDNQRMHIIEITAPDGFRDIRYTTDGTEPTTSSTKYAPSTYWSSDSKKYYGALIESGKTVKAVAFNGDERTFIAEITPSVSSWDISITDNGSSSDDETMRIVTIEDNVWAGDIYYTTDGTEPSTASQKYNPHSYSEKSVEYTGILIPKGHVVKAISYKTINGNVHSSNIAVETLGVFQWNISIVDNGSYADDVTKHIITITDRECSGDIYYTIGSTNPDSKSTKYSPQSYKGSDSITYTGILVSELDTVNAVSYKTEDGTVKSSYISTKAIDIAEWPISIVDYGQYASDGSKHIVSITDSRRNGTIYYSTGSTSPTSSSAKYAVAKYIGSDGNEYEGILVSENTTLNAISYITVNGVTGKSSVTSKFMKSFLWIIQLTDNGSWADDLSKHIVTMTDSVKSGAIHYTTDSTAPTSASTSYEPQSYNGSDGKTYVGVLVAERDTVKAISYKAEDSYLKFSSVISKTIDIAPWSITVVDNGQYYGDGSKHIVSITDSGRSGTIYYTIGSTTPTSSSTKYETVKYTGVDGNEYEGILVSEGTTLKAISYATVNGGTGSSNIATLTVDTYQWAITITDNGAYAADASKHIMTITDTERSGTIYYTTESSSPKSDSTEYVPHTYNGSDGNSYEGILIEEGYYIHAISYSTKDGAMKSSSIEEKLVEIEKWTISLTDYGQSLDNGSYHIISVSDSVRNGNIYYTTNGDDPTQSSTKYSPETYTANDGNEYEGICVKEGATLKAVSYADVNCAVGISNVLEKKTDTYQWPLQIRNNGVNSSDNSEYIVSITDSINDGEIYYTTDGSYPTLLSTRYSPTSYKDNSSQTYTGVTIPVEKTVNAVAYKQIDGIVKSSSVITIKLSYKVGEIGQAGGYVFYDKGSYSNGWRYLEAAPSDLDTTYEYGGYGTSIGNTSKTVGTGQSNTESIVKKLGAGTYAAKACSDYTYNGYDDWFLPSRDELNLMYTNLYKKGVGNFKDDGYWSSSESTNYRACFHWFGDGLQGNTSRNYDGLYVRPVRSF